MLGIVTLVPNRGKIFTYVRAVKESQEGRDGAQLNTNVI